MIDEIRGLIRELKNPALLVILGAMVVLLLLLSHVRFTV